MTTTDRKRGHLDRKLGRLWEVYNRTVARAAFARDGREGSPSRLVRAREEAADLAARINQTETALGLPLTVFTPLR